MSSRRENLIIILALLQRNTLIEQKWHIKMLKTALFDCAINANLPRESPVTRTTPSSRGKSVPCNRVVA